MVDINRARAREFRFAYGSAPFPGNSMVVLLSYTTTGDSNSDPSGSVHLQDKLSIRF